MGLKTHYPTQTSPGSENAISIHLDTNVVHTLSAFGGMPLDIPIKIKGIGPFFDPRSPELAVSRQPPVFPPTSSMRNFSPNR
jgi:hypothetical protein